MKSRSMHHNVFYIEKTDGQKNFPYLIMFVSPSFYFLICFQIVVLTLMWNWLVKAWEQTTINTSHKSEEGL